MAQAGIHGLVGAAVRRWLPEREGLMLGVVLGNLLPDADNLAVAVATVANLPQEGLHRTFTHSIFFALAVYLILLAASKITGKPGLGALGAGLGIGVVMHSVLDLLMWFNGVEILWPIPLWINFWEGVTPAVWWSKLMMPIEFLFFALFVYALYAKAVKTGKDNERLRMLKVWIAVQGVLFVLFTVLVYTMDQGFMTPFGGLYLLSLIWTAVIVVQMRDTVEAAVAV